MNRNPVTAATELVDATPSREFLSTLHAKLLADFTESAATEIPAESKQEYVTLAPTPPPVGPNRRIPMILLAVAACVAVFATGAMIVTRADRAAIELRDVNQQEAVPLAQRALIPRDATPDGVGHGWSSDPYWAEIQPSEAAATIAALPGCALLRSVGLLPPTAKSAAVYQFAVAAGLMHHVFVFATPEDASRAMDVIAGDLYPTCWFDVYDRRDADISQGRAAAISEAWGGAPGIVRHGDRQVIIGQHTSELLGPFRGEHYLVNAYVQVGRAISFINPEYMIDTNDPLLAVENDIAAATTALTNVFGP
jgi:hypothetical protein